MTQVVLAATVVTLLLSPAAARADEEETETTESGPAVAYRLLANTSAYSYTGSMTRSQTWPVWGTVAVDPRVIPLGSRLLINGFPNQTFTALDTGGLVTGNSINIYFPSQAEAIRYGRQTRLVSVLAPALRRWERLAERAHIWLAWATGGAS